MKPLHLIGLALNTDSVVDNEGTTTVVVAKWYFVYLAHHLRHRQNRRELFNMVTERCRSFYSRQVFIAEVTMGTFAHSTFP